MLKLLITAAAFISCAAQSSNTMNNTGIDTSNFHPPKIVKEKSIYDFKVPALDGSTIDFAAFKGKKILIVNTASECGYTPQYEGLEALYEKYKEKLVIVGFPANNFGGQEPGSNDEIKTFCKKNYGVSFPMAAKVSVKGDDMADIYKWLTSKTENGVLDAEIKWNFNKFLIDENGKLLYYFESKVTPMSAELTSKL
ncbi:MAG: glutathione peroxidase [Chitinophagaceae bacterium]|nr:glutathione peroxidase [Chitinophagaceae bacterium]